jgi:plastocyanin
LRVGTSEWVDDTMCMKFRAILIFLTLLCGVSDSALAATNIVRIITDSSVGTRYFYIPSNTVIRTMDTIRWTNTTATPHDTTSSSSPTLWTTAPFTSPSTYSFTFTNVGYYPYHCLVHSSHPEQNGTISVVSLTVTNPASNAIIAANSPFNLSASASTNVASIQFFTNGISAGIDGSSPFSLSLGGLPLGTYTTAAKVIDTRGNTNTFAGPTFFVETISLSELASTKSSVSFNVHGGSFGQRCIIYASTDLGKPGSWTPVFTNTFPNTLCPTCPFVTFQDTNAASGPQRFFRAQVIP